MKCYSATIGFEDIDDEANSTELLPVDLPEALDVGRLNVYLNILTDEGYVVVRVELDTEALGHTAEQVPAFASYQRDAM